ncbi:MAG TPA: pitrilysin family protein [Vicinamibacterales bacterium]|nr:pitrilysin family protein [Vicinamibacterales bacterium]
MIGRRGQRQRAVGLGVAALFLIGASAGARQALDRTKIPPAGPTPVLHVPAWTRSTLSNGAELIVSERPGLPIVQFGMTFLGGANQYEPANRRGMAGLTAAMMSEGTKTRDADALANALLLLGSEGTNFGIGGESGSAGFLSTASRFKATLDILVDKLLNSTFPAEALERLRAQRLVTFNQNKAQPGWIAGRVFPRVLYGADHPYGQYVTEESLKAITRDDVVAFAKAYFQPGRALITVVGDVKAPAVKAQIESALASWPKGGEKPVFQYPAVPAARPTTIHLVDKPGAAQSTFRIGNPGPARNTPDYYALEVMNTMLGGLFQSRLNANIREEKGYSYGVSSRFAYGRGPGQFQAGGDIVSAKTDLALVEFMKELRGITGSRPVTDEEMTAAKNSLVLSLPDQFGSVGGVNGAITNLWITGLPDDYYQQFSARIAAVTKEDVVRVAKKYIDLDHLAIVIVGDRSTIEAPLKATNIAPIVIADMDGNVMK